MNKLVALTLLFGLLQIASASKITCNNDDQKKCSMEVGKALDENIKEAHINMVKKIIQNHIDVCRELKMMCKEGENECRDTIDKIVHEQKNDLEKLDEQEGDQQAQQATIKRLLGNIKKETLKTVVNENDLKKMAENKHPAELLNAALDEFLKDVLWHSKETVIELKEKNIQMDDVVQQVDEMQRVAKSTDSNVEKVDKVTEILEKMSEKLDMPWTEGLDDINEADPEIIKMLMKTNA